MTKKDDRDPKERPEPIPGFTRLVDFIKAQAKARQKSQDPQFQKRQKAIAAYKKTKAS